MSKKIIAVLSAAVLSAGLAAPALAASTNDDQGGGIINVNGQVYGRGGVNSNTASGSADVGGSVDVGLGDASEPTATTDETDATPVVVTRGDVEAGAGAGASVSAADVRTKADLSDFIAGEIGSDGDLSQVQSSGSAVHVTYSQHARLFGLIPMLVHVTTTVTADGSLDVSYPWYSFLLVKEGGDVRSTVEGVVRNDVGLPAQANANAQASANMGVSQQARLISDIKAALKAQLEASGSANVN